MYVIGFDRLTLVSNYIMAKIKKGNHKGIVGIKSG